jgi:hypothetical protein
VPPVMSLNPDPKPTEDKSDEDKSIEALYNSSIVHCWCEVTRMKYAKIYGKREGHMEGEGHYFL